MRERMPVPIIFKTGVETFDNDFRQKVLNKHADFTTPEQVAASRDLVNQIYIDDAVRGYIVDLVRATRFPETVDVKLRGLIRAGASPRATINLALAARANAFMHHRSFVTPQDIKDLAHDILRHRILLSYEAEAENISTDDVIDHILTKVPVP